MKKDKTEIVIVMDRSGSMRGIKEDMEGGLKTLLDDQRKEAGECNVTFVKFDDQYEEVFASKPIAEVEDLELDPRGMTALLDALGRTIDAAGHRFAALDEAERPEHVFFVVITDGHENSSVEYPRTQIMEMIKHQTEKYNWDFTYLGANQDAIAVAESMGMKGGATLDFAANAAGVRGAYAGTSHKLSSIRSGVATCDTYSFDEDQKKAAMGEDTPEPSMASSESD